ncbi:hypothetical protein A1O3_06855 [Capronia epimyces CBS 606.96]|uniref:NADH:flavin oxidoreductase/NADH oxidase N-terminal domain-containing protein n=1 Tax=Capronia epimyces CBS 606.96 TaxID=1182542 RepID=W9XS37_9EURO|nr:uncharacterized protein A1O3_06855 [Capronia epimyces CBS 606.96]EXJ83038.1 hypothetical protein A1O3_06855 [Capronia epimyces CBS 606.96]
MAPLGRLRADRLRDGVYTANSLNAEYYGQRASKGGLQLTESTPISRRAAGYPGIAGIFTPEQVEAFKPVTEAVHAKGGFIFCQLWHAGRASIPDYLDGETPVSSSAVALPGSFVGPGPKEYPAVVPKALTQPEIDDIVQDFAAAAKRAIAAGFDGVEIHGANGYLIEQFLHDNINQRTDQYGGNIQNRCRFPLEVLRAVTSAVGSERTGIRLSPFNYFHGTRDSDPMGHWAYLCEQIVALPRSNRPAYVNSIQPQFDEMLSEEAKMKALAASASTSTTASTSASASLLASASAKQDTSTYSLTPFRRILQRGDIKFLAAGNYNRDNALPTIENDEADGVIFGRHFIANPDLPRRLAEGLPLNPYDRSTFYGANPPSKGYTDYPFWSSDLASSPSLSASA